MRQEAGHSPFRGRDGRLLLRAGAAGRMDVASYLGLGHVFKAMMTGNTVLPGLALGQGHLLAALRSVLALVGFAIGVALAAEWVLRARQERAPAVTSALAIEGALLAGFSLKWHLAGPGPDGAAGYGLIVMAGLAMGIQSCAVHRLRVPGVMTTCITGTLTSLMSDLTGRRRQSVPPGAASRPHGRRVRARGAGEGPLAPALARPEDAAPRDRGADRGRKRRALPLAWAGSVSRIAADCMESSVVTNTSAHLALPKTDARCGAK